MGCRAPISPISNPPSCSVSPSPPARTASPPGTQHTGKESPNQHRDFARRPRPQDSLGSRPGYVLLSLFRLGRLG
eukprot:1182222-Prorocentrum_minimum.AAC.2